MKDLGKDTAWMRRRSDESDTAQVRSAGEDREWRLTCVRGLASIMAHRLAQPMTAINALASSSLRAARDPASDGGRLIANLTKIDEQARRASDMIRGFSRFAYHATPDVGDLDPAAAVDAALTALAPDAGRDGIAMRLDAAAGLPRVAADPGVVEHIVSGLVRNAIGALATSDSERREIVVSVARTDDGMVEVAVADTGPGIDPAIARGIFDPFDPDRPEECGVGLAVSRAVVEALGGRLDVRSGTGGGAVIAFVLPVAKQGETGERRVS